jgi:hypothetical protein
MNIANTLAVLMGSALVIVGITVFNKSYFNAMLLMLAHDAWRVETNAWPRVI